MYFSNEKKIAAKVVFNLANEISWIISSKHNNFLQCYLYVRDVRQVRESFESRILFCAALVLCMLNVLNYG